MGWIEYLLIVAGSSLEIFVAMVDFYSILSVCCCFRYLYVLFERA